MVRVHKNRSADRKAVPCRCWIILTPQNHGAKILATAQDVLLRNVRFHGPDRRKWQSGWAIGELLWTRQALDWPPRPPDLTFPLEEFEGSSRLREAPQAGWERLRFLHGLGFGIGTDRRTAEDNLVAGVPWMLLTPDLDGVIRA